MRHLLAIAILASATAAIAESSESGPMGSFKRALDPPEFRFPADHGNHPGFSTEWWYLTGSVRDEVGRLYGFQATFFRKALVPSRTARASTLAAREILLFHGGWTEIDAGSYTSDEAISRVASNWAGSQEGRLHVWLRDNHLEDRGEGLWTTRFRVADIEVELELEPQRPPLLHGRQAGLSVKGEEPGQASYYYSQTRLQVRGRFREATERPWRSVEGGAWFDHEVFSDQLPAGYEGWDWFSVALDDGADLMVFQIREGGGSTAVTSSGTLRSDDDERIHLDRDDFEIEVTSTWTSPGDPEGVSPYPSGWRIRVPKHGIELEVRPLVADQEHRGERADQLTYWEGLCRFEGFRNGVEVAGQGYVELVGYRGRGPGDL